MAGTFGTFRTFGTEGLAALLQPALLRQLKMALEVLSGQQAMKSWVGKAGNHQSQGEVIPALPSGGGGEVTCGCQKEGEAIVANADSPTYTGDIVMLLGEHLLQFTNCRRSSLTSFFSCIRRLKSRIRSSWMKRRRSF